MADQTKVIPGLRPVRKSKNKIHMDIELGETIYFIVPGEPIRKKRWFFFSCQGGGFGRLVPLLDLGSVGIAVFLLLTGDWRDGFVLK